MFAKMYPDSHYTELKRVERLNVKEAKSNPPRYATLDDVSRAFSGDMDYARKRLHEGLDTMASMLNYRLQPHFKKCGSCDLVSIPFVLFDYWFCTVNKCKRTHKVFRDTVDGVRIPARRFYYKFDSDKGGLPTFSRKVKIINWANRFHDDGQGVFVTRKKSQYKSITFVCCERTGRVYCRYVQETYGEITFGDDLDDLTERLWVHTC
jgi:hypothetical protein